MDCHRPSAFAMTMWVRCGDYHNEIAMASTKPRNDRFGLCAVVAILRLPRAFQALAMTSVDGSRNDSSFLSLQAKRSNPQPSFTLPFVIARSNATKQSITTNSQCKNKKQKNSLLTNKQEKNKNKTIKINYFIIIKILWKYKIFNFYFVNF